MYEQVTLYYREQAKRAKLALDRLHAAVPLALVVRYNFKVAAYSELRQDMKTAIKHYTLAYEALMDSLPAPSDLKLVEIKCVAEIINYKVRPLFVRLCCVVLLSGC